MIKKLARWILREELKVLNRQREFAEEKWALWYGRYNQLAAQTFGEGFSPFPKDEA